MNKELLWEMLSTPSASGRETELGKKLYSYAGTFSHQVRTDEIGDVVAVLNPDCDFRVLLAGHMDEIALLVTAVTHTIVGFLAVVAAYGALYLVATGTIDPLVSGDQAIYAFSDYLGIWAQVLVYAAILAAALSSASMFLTSSSTLISKDLTSALGIKIAPEKQINVSRVFMFVLGAVSIVVSIYSTEMVALLGTFGWGTLVSGTFPVFVLGLLWERCNEKGVMCGVAVSLVFNIIPFFGFKFPSALPGYFITSALAVAVTVVVSIIVPKKELSPQLDAVLKL